MGKRISKDEEEFERRRQKALQRLGTNDPQCVVCGEDNWQCLELHHIAGKAYDEMTIILCRNCHRKQSNPSINSRSPNEPQWLERIGHFLLGLAELLIALAIKLKEYGKQLIEGAAI